MFDRREFLKTVGTLSLVTIAAQQKAFGLAYRGEGAQWAKDMRALSDKLIDRRISAENWQTGVDKIYSQADFAALLRSIDFAAVREGMTIKDDAGNWLSVFIAGLSQSGDVKQIYTKIVGLKGGRTVPPHGHENEVSVFLTLNGEFRLRQWDRRAVNKDSLDIVPVFDGRSLPGQWSSQSEEKTNIHWLTTESEEAFFLSVRVAKIDGTQGGRTRIPVDPDGAEYLGRGVYRAAIMDNDAWWQKYGRKTGV